MDSSICYIKGLQVEILKVCYVSLPLFFIVAYSTDPDEMSHCAAFHLGLHCLPKYLFAGIQNEKV